MFTNASKLLKAVSVMFLVIGIIASVIVMLILLAVGTLPSRVLGIAAFVVGASLSFLISLGMCALSGMADDVRRIRDIKERETK